MGGGEGVGKAWRKKTDLRLPIILLLRLPPHARPPLVGIDQIADGVVHHARAARVHERLDARRLLRALDQVPRPLQVHLSQQLLVVHRRWQRGRVDDDVRVHLLEDFADGGERSDVGGVVVCPVVPVARRCEV